MRGSPRKGGVRNVTCKKWGVTFWGHHFLGVQDFGVIIFWGSKILGVQDLRPPDRGGVRIGTLLRPLFLGWLQTCKYLGAVCGTFCMCTKIVVKRVLFRGILGWEGPPKWVKKGTFLGPFLRPLNCLFCRLKSSFLRF